MTITEKELEQYRNTLSIDRIRTFIQNKNDTINDVLERYKNNIKISQALYPELSILEVTLRNSINSTLCKYISESWIEEEIKEQNILSNHDRELLIKTYNDVKKECKNGDFTIGKVIAELNFGFWTNLCSKWYCSNIWNKGCCFKGIFVNYPYKTHQINNISVKLRSIRKLRNRIFHYEPILKNPATLLKKYDEIMEILSFLPKDNANILKDTTSFLEIYNEVTKPLSKTKT